ncbi:unnamed protein product [Caenorhabditis auriculariae]|uniref:SH2 domain-containing protein n=1 Tax=Caenorhabditis auriculariae TaxID=2777116 RepID=A0A8S1HTP7_9PELO|nr:unnamed protein product [Caenorhabditis auriculariae]
MTSRTPYNSLYEKLKKVEQENVCCVHGTPCELGKTAENDEQYVNLGASQQDDLMSTLAKRLGTLAVDEEKKAKNKPEVESIQALQGGNEESAKKKKRTCSERESSIRTSDLNDNRSFVVLGRQTLPDVNYYDTNFRAPPAAGPRGLKNTLASDVPAPLGDAMSIYLGVMNYADAESSVGRRSDFRLYHQLSSRAELDDLHEQLPLMIVYKTANGSYRHYPIRSELDSDGSPQYSVDYGNLAARRHSSLNQLVKYYQIYVFHHPKYSAYADPFPWWLN